MLCLQEVKSEMDERIKELRKALHVTQQEFADKLGTARNNIAGYEIGRRLPSDAVITLICRTFSVNETWLRTGEGEMFRPNPSDALSKFVQERGLTQADQALIEKFAALDAASRQTVVDYVLATADAIMSLEPTPAIETEQPKSQTVEEVETEYIKTMSALAREKERTVSSSTAAEVSAKIS